MKYVFTLISLCASLFCVEAKCQAPVRTYVFTTPRSCCVPNGDAISYEDIADSSSISIKDLGKIRLYEGTVYFATKPFRKSIDVDFNTWGEELIGKQEAFIDQFKKTKIGSKVIFKKCVFINTDGTRTSQKTKVLMIKE